MKNKLTCKKKRKKEKDSFVIVTRNLVQSVTAADAVDNNTYDIIKGCPVAGMIMAGKRLCFGLSQTTTKIVKPLHAKACPPMP